MTRKTILSNISKTAAKLQKNRAEGVSIQWSLSALFVQLQETFPQGKDGRKAFLASAATAAGCSESQVVNLIRAHEVRGSLTKSQATATAKWGTDAILTLSGKDMTTAKRTQLISKVSKSGTVNVKTVRDLKRQVMGTSKRTRKSSAAQTRDLAKTIGERVAGMVKDGDAYLTLIHGAQLAQDYPGKDVAAALTLISTQARKAAEVVGGK